MHMLQVVEDVMSCENAPKIYIAAIVRTKLNVKEALHYTHTHSLLVLAFLHAKRFLIISITLLQLL